MENSRLSSADLLATVYQDTKRFRERVATPWWLSAVLGLGFAVILVITWLFAPSAGPWKWGWLIIVVLLFEVSSVYTRSRGSIPVARPETKRCRGARWLRALVYGGGIATMLIIGEISRSVSVAVLIALTIGVLAAVAHYATDRLAFSLAQS